MAHKRHKRHHSRKKKFTSRKHPRNAHGRFKRK